MPEPESESELTSGAAPRGAGAGWSAGVSTGVAPAESGADPRATSGSEPDSPESWFSTTVRTALKTMAGGPSGAVMILTTPLSAPSKSPLTRATRVAPISRGSETTREPAANAAATSWPPM